MSTPSRMTIAWDRLDQMGLLPQDSSVVEPPPITTIAWTPLLGPTIFDYDPSDFVITPGGGEEVVVTPPPTEGGGGGGTPPGGESGTGTGTGSGTPPAGETGTGGGGGPAPHYGHPQLKLTHRRTVKLFLKDGFFVDIDVTAPAHVRAVLQTKAKGAKGKVQTFNLTKVLNTEVGADGGKVTLQPSRAGRMALSKVKGQISATLVLVVNYGNGQKPVQMSQHVSIVG
jgi:hypothetical protein